MDTPEKTEVENARRKREKGKAVGGSGGEGAKRRKVAAEEPKGGAIPEEVVEKAAERLVEKEPAKAPVKLIEKRVEKPRARGKRMQAVVPEQEEREAAEAEARAIAAAREPQPEPEEEDEPEEDSDVEAELEDVEEPEEEYQVTPPPPAPPKKSAKSTSRPANAPDETRAPRPRAAGIPITVYRLSAPTSEDAPDLPPQSTVNPVDIVLSLFSELIDKFSAKLTTTVEKKAVERFKSELELRLLELTSELEGAVSATKQARQKKKEKQTVLERLLEVKQDRRELAIQMEQVREKHRTGQRENEVCFSIGCAVKTVC